MATRPANINPRWLNQRRIDESSTEKTINGIPNPSYVRCLAELEAAEAEYERWQAFEAWVKKTLGARLNDYPLRKPEGTYDRATVFVKKDKDTGEITFWTRTKAWEMYEAAEAAIAKEDQK